MKRYLTNRWRERSTKLAIVGLAMALLSRYVESDITASVTALMLALVGVTPDKS